MPYKSKGTSPSDWAMATSVLNSVSSHVAMLDAEGHIVYVNKAWTEFAKQNHPKGKKTSGTGIGINYLEVLKKSKGKNAEEAQAALKGIQAVIDGKKQKFMLEYPCHSKTEQRWFTMTVLPLPKGKETWAVVTHHNITGSKLLELARKKQVVAHKKYSTELEQKVLQRTQQLERALKKEKKLKEFKTQFIINTSHEFRTPLTVMKLSVTLAKKFQGANNKNVVEEKLNLIDTQIEHISFLLDKILMIGRSNFGTEKISLTEVELIPLIDEIVRQTEAEGSSGRIVTEVGALPGKIISDEALLRKILSNLLSNALKFSPADSKVHLVVASSNQKLLIEIIDTGIGIPKPNQDLIFRPFYKGSNAQVIYGPGLGLSIVKKSVHLLKGKISFESKEGKGAAFKVVLPLVSK